MAAHPTPDVPICVTCGALPLSPTTRKALAQLRPDGDVALVVATLARLAAEGATRPGSWEAQIAELARPAIEQAARPAPVQPSEGKPHPQREAQALAMRAKGFVFKAQDATARIGDEGLRGELADRLARVRAELEALDRAVTSHAIEHGGQPKRLRTKGRSRGGSA